MPKGIINTLTQILLKDEQKKLKTRPSKHGNINNKNQ